MAHSATNLKVSSALDYASGTADRTGTVLDMAGFDGVLMIVKFAAIATGATTSVKAQQGAAANMSDAADLEGSGITVADDDDNQLFVINMYRPAERYVRIYVDKDTSNASGEAAIYVQYGGSGALPRLASVTDALTLESHFGPAEGTA